MASQCSSRSSATGPSRNASRTTRKRQCASGLSESSGCACRLASVMFMLEMGLCLSRSHFRTIGDALGLFIIAASPGLFISAVTWILYLALEPWVRRHWPQTVISWSRLVSGQARDPLLGRDILFGVILGMVWILVFQIRYIPMIRMGAAPGLASTEAL